MIRKEHASFCMPEIPFGRRKEGHWRLQCLRQVRNIKFFFQNIIHAQVSLCYYKTVK